MLEARLWVSKLVSMLDAGSQMLVKNPKRKLSLRGFERNEQPTEQSLLVTFRRFETFGRLNVLSGGLTRQPIYMTLSSIGYGDPTPPIKAICQKQLSPHITNLANVQAL